MITLEEAKKLVGFIPKDPEYYPRFLEGLDQDIKEKGETWVKEHRSMIHAGWEYVETLL